MGENIAQRIRRLVQRRYYLVVRDNVSEYGGDGTTPIPATTDNRLGSVVESRPKTRNHPCRHIVEDNRLQASELFLYPYISYLLYNPIAS